MTRAYEHPAAPQFRRPPPPTGPLLSQLAGMSDARAWGENLLVSLQAYYGREIPWSDVDPGCVLHGPPGTGKTTFAKALAATCKLPLIATGFGEWQAAGDGYLGTLIKAMQDAFAAAKECAPCIFFIDELDSVPMRGSGSRHAFYETSFTNALLKEFDKLGDTPGVIVIGACNHPDKLDAALIRSGRMDRMIAIELPSANEIENIIRFHLRRDERAAILDRQPHVLSALALQCVGMSGADIAKLVRDARSRARMRRSTLAVADLSAVLDPPDNRPDPGTQKRIAIHEAGHAIAALRLCMSDNITLTIIGRGSSAGKTTIQPTRPVHTCEDIEDFITVNLAGRAAEEIVLGSTSILSGGDSEHSDLAAANRLACNLIAKFGFSHRAGLLWYPGENTANGALKSGPLADECKEILTASYSRAKSILERDIAYLNDVASQLVARRTLAHADLLALDPKNIEREPARQNQWKGPASRLFRSR